MTVPCGLVTLKGQSIELERMSLYVIFGKLFGNLNRSVISTGMNNAVFYFLSIKIQSSLQMPIVDISRPDDVYMLHRFCVDWQLGVEQWLEGRIFDDLDDLLQWIPWNDNYCKIPRNSRVFIPMFLLLFQVSDRRSSIRWITPGGTVHG